MISTACVAALQRWESLTVSSDVLIEQRIPIILFVFALAVVFVCVFEFVYFVVLCCVGLCVGTLRGLHCGVCVWILRLVLWCCAGLGCIML